MIFNKKDSMEKKNISEYLPEAAKKWSDVTAIKFKDSAISFKNLEKLSNIYAEKFTAQGITKGTRTLMMLKPGIEFIAAVFAVFKAGAVPVFIDPGMGVSNLLNCIKKTQPEAMIGISKAHWIRLFFPKNFSTIKIFFSLGKGSPFWLNKLPAYGIADADSGSHEFQIEQCELDDTAAIVFTTGSTGPPKGVVYTHRIYITQMQIISKVYGAGPKEMDMPAFPLFALFSAAMGMPCVIPDINPSLPAKVDPEVIIDTISKNNVTFSFASPALWSRICIYCLKNKEKLPTLKRVLMAGAPVNPELHSVLKKIISDDGETFVPYGATEALPIANMCGTDMTDEIKEKVSSGQGYCLGRPLEGIKISVIKSMEGVIEKWDESLVVPDGETGEIVIEGPVVTPEYYELPEETSMGKIRKDNGKIIHRMGDMGYFDKDGYLWFKGRKAHRVINGEKTLYPVCCEAIFNAHKNVFRSGLVGIGPENNQTPLMIIQPVPGILPIYGEKRKKFIEELKELGSKREHTAEIDKFLFNADFPVDIRHNAKISREKLAEWAKKFEF
jgi:acyl-CoA synthetase (AMP-forming)/AMP-acid ligase II